MGGVSRNLGFSCSFLHRLTLSSCERIRSVRDREESKEREARSDAIWGIPFHIEVSRECLER